MECIKFRLSGNVGSRDVNKYALLPSNYCPALLTGQHWSRHSLFVIVYLLTCRIVRFWGITKQIVKKCFPRSSISGQHFTNFGSKIFNDDLDASHYLYNVSGSRVVLDEWRRERAGCAPAWHVRYTVDCQMPTTKYIKHIWQVAARLYVSPSSFHRVLLQTRPLYRLFKFRFCN